MAPSTTYRAEPARLSAAIFRAKHRGGGLLSEALSQRMGSYLALAAYKLGLAPTHLTMASLCIGVSASIALIAAAGIVAAGGWIIALLALVLWNLAYGLDCADGQLARVTGRASAAGARVDILSDVAVQISVVAAISTVALAAAPTTPGWLVALFAASWMVNLVTSVLATGSASASLVTSRSVLVRVVKLVRDYAAIITVCGLVLAVRPTWTPWLMAAMSASNSGFLLLSVAHAARGSLAKQP